MEKDWKRILTEIVADNDQHALFLNTVSLMEYMGARKIIKSQIEYNINSEVLLHIAEEVRHAQIFKKMALKLSEGKLKTYRDEHLLAGVAARNYIQSIDKSVEGALDQQDSYYNYLFSTLIIESRANKVYPFYAELMAPLGLSSNLKRILKEEENHLNQIESLLLNSNKISNKKINSLYVSEDESFNQFITFVKKSLNMNKINSASGSFCE